MFHNYGFEVATILKNAENIRYDLRHPYVGTEHLLLSILGSSNEVISLFLEYGISYDSFLEQLMETVGQASSYQELNLYTPMLKRVLEIANMNALENNKGVVTPTYLVLALLEEGEGIAIRILLSMGVSLDELYFELKQSIAPKSKRNKNLEVLKIGVLMGQNISREKVIVGRDKELDYMIETLLRRQKNNPLLLGKAGVGKTALVEELARRIKYHEVPHELEGMEIVLLEMGALVAGTKYRGEFEERLNKIIKEVVHEKNIILFIDEIHTMVNAGGAEGAIAASDILKPYLARGELKIIGATTLAEYHEFLERDKALDRRFEKIMIEEPNEEMMQTILDAVVPTYEKYYDITITDENKKSFLYYSKAYLFNKSNPDKTLDLLDSVCARKKVKESIKSHGEDVLDKIKRKKVKSLKSGDYQMALKEAMDEEALRKSLKQKKSSYKLEITDEDILEMIESKTNFWLQKDEDMVLQHLQEALQNSLLGQDDVIKKLVDSFNLNSQKNMSFLLVGGSGVGKTETVKIVSEELKTEFIRIDMSEYSSLESVHRLIGAPPGYVGYQEPYVLETLREQPFTTVLFDEIEKAHPQVLNLLLQILDEGFVTDSRGNKIRFDHTYIFLTSNAQVKKSVGFATSAGSNFDGVFSKELLGRIDAVVEYQPITREVALEFIERELKNPKIKSLDLICEGEIERYGLRHIRNLILKYNKQAEYQEN